MVDNDEQRAPRPDDGDMRPVRSRWRSTSQNFEFEIEAARSEISKIEKTGDLSEDQAKALDRCKELLPQLARAYGRFLPRELFIWQSLYLIQQYLLIAVPFEELRAKWDSMQRRISQLKEKDDENPLDEGSIGWVTERLKTDEKPSADEERTLRAQIREIRKYLDDQIVLQLWRNIRLRRFSIVFAWATFVLAGLLIVIISFPVFDCFLDRCAGAGRQHSIFGVAIAGTIGALLSALTRGRSVGEDQAPLSFELPIERPIVGAISGLFLYLVYESAIIDVTYPALYAFAIAFGFSERPFLKLLDKLSRETERGIGKVFR